MKNTRYSGKDVARWFEEYKAGSTFKAIAKRYGCSPTTVRDRLDEASYPLRSPKKFRDHHPLWKGGRVRHMDYIKRRVQPDDPLYPYSTNGYMLEHRYVLGTHLGRPLEPYETVHHINGDKTDNRLENLQLHRKRHGKGVRLVCNCCGSSDIREEPL